MNDITFRGKPVDENINKFVYGSLFRNFFYRSKTSEEIIYIASPDLYPEYDSFEDMKYLVIEVDPKTVGESRGQKDKQGKNIFTGDIIKYSKHHFTDCSKKEIERIEDPIIGEFYFAEGLFPGLRFKDGTGMVFWPGGFDSEIEFEVIGNVTENSYLLEEKAQ